VIVFEQLFSLPGFPWVIVAALVTGALSRAPWQLVAMALAAGFGLFFIYVGKHAADAPMMLWSYQLVCISVAGAAFLMKHFIFRLIGRTPHKRRDRPDSLAIW